jgi:hypothetical protein
VLDDQQRRWREGKPLLVEDYLQQQPALKSDAITVFELIYSEIAVREELGGTPSLKEYVQRFPQYEVQLRSRLEPATARPAPPVSASKTDAANGAKGDRPAPPPRPAAPPLNVPPTDVAEPDRGLAPSETAGPTITPQRPPDQLLANEESPLDWGPLGPAPETHPSGTAAEAAETLDVPEPTAAPPESAPTITPQPSPDQLLAGGEAPPASS